MSRTTRAKRFPWQEGWAATRDKKFGPRSDTKYLRNKKFRSMVKDSMAKGKEFPVFRKINDWDWL